MPYLVDLGTDEQKQRWLPGCATGEIVTAIGMTEPGGGSDLAALKTTAVRDGDEWVINGSKTFITNGYSADLVLTAVRTSPEKGAKGITLFGLEATDEGFSRGRKLDKVGQSEADTSELFFENVRVGDDRIIGEVDRGFIYMMERLPQERLSCCGLQRRARQADPRRDDPVRPRPRGVQAADRQPPAQQVPARRARDQDRGRRGVRRPGRARRTRNGEATAIDAAKAKWWSSEIQNDVLDHCVQLHGGYGFMNEYRVARAWRDARVSKIWAGSNEIMKELIGRDLGF